jgi:hypothetical protein
MIRVADRMKNGALAANSAVMAQRDRALHESGRDSNRLMDGRIKARP